MQAPDRRVAVVIEDDEDIRNLLGTVLTQAGFDVTLCANGYDGIDAARSLDPTVVTLDVNMPGIDGFETAKRLRTFSSAYIVMLTALGEEIDTLQGLEAGADDYVTKPFNPRELLARVKAVLRRAQSLPPRQALPRGKAILFDRWTLDVGRRELVSADGVAVPLSTGEFRLLSALLDHPGVVLTRDQLLDLTVGRAAEIYDRSIDNQVSRLRRKIELDPKNPVLIKTHWGGGYSFTAEVHPQ